MQKRTGAKAAYRLAGMPERRAQQASYGRASGPAGRQNPNRRWKCSYTPLFLSRSLNGSVRSGHYANRFARRFQVYAILELRRGVGHAALRRFSMPAPQQVEAASRMKRKCRSSMMDLISIIVDE